MSKKILLAPFFILIASISFAGTGAPWGYEGANGPKYWAGLDPDFSACSGVNQSPINISGATQALLPEIEFNYNDAPFSMLNNGHTILLNYGPGSSITVGDKTFELVQFHFHSPSENHINGVSYPMEVHLVHKDVDGNVAVVGVMFKEGAENPMVRGLWSHLDDAKVGHAIEDSYVTINAYGLLPTNNQEYYRFNGSLTTPPCTEGVTWFVMKEPLQISAAQIKRFVRLIGHNNRPIQPINARPVLR